MRWAVEKESLLSAIDRVSRIVKSNPRSVDILQCVKVSTYAQQVYLTATSSMASVKVQVRGAVLSDGGEFVINLDKLRDRVSKAGSKIVLQSDDSTLKIMSSNDQKLGLRLADPREFPEVKWVLVDESYGLPTNEVVNLLKHAHSITSSTSGLTPAFLQAKFVDRKMLVSSGVSFHKFDVECNPALNSSIPTQTLSPLTAFIQESEGDTIWLSQDDSDEVVISVGNDQFQTSSLAIAFPDLEPLFEKVRIASDADVRVNRKDLIRELNNAKNSADDYGRVSLTMEGTLSTFMVVRCESASGEWFEAKLPCLWAGTEGRTLVFNVESLVKFLQSFTTDDSVLYVGDDSKKDLAAVYCSEEGHSGIINQFRI